MAGSPASAAFDYATQLAISDVAKLIVDNSTFSSTTGVNWTAGDGQIAAAVGSASTPTNWLPIDGFDSVQILGGSGTNSLSVVSLAGSTNATIDGPSVTLQAGADVLQGSSFNSYENFSQLGSILNFSGLTAPAASYTQQLSSGSFTVSGSVASVTLAAEASFNECYFPSSEASDYAFYPGEAITGSGFPAGTPRHPDSVL